jgi:hypothetical protein
VPPEQFRHPELAVCGSKNVHFAFDSGHSRIPAYTDPFLKKHSERGEQPEVLAKA